MQSDKFALRHIGPNEEEITKMLAALEVDSLEGLLSETLPEEIRLPQQLTLREGISEYRFLNNLRALSNENKLFETYIGLGYNPTVTPAVIQRNIMENPGWYTAYTPYQAEIAQGRLEALFNFQSMVCDLTGMELANASLLDEATAVAEAMSLCYLVRSKDQKKVKANKLFVSDDILPQSLAVLKTRALPLGVELVEDNAEKIEFDASFFGAIFQYPSKDGAITDLPKLVNKAKAFELKTIVAADLLSLTLLEAPGSYDVDVVVGTTQRFGIPLGYGGPHAAYFATKVDYKRNIPGRIIGQTRDQDDNRAFRMALQTREQHIKRDRATSNICTAQVLLAVMAGMYAVYHGPKGLKRIAKRIHLNAAKLEKKLMELGLTQLNTYYFDTLRIRINAAAVKAKAEENEINFNYIDEETVAIAINETTDEVALLKVLNVFEKVVHQKNINGKVKIENHRYPLDQKRRSPYLENKIFNSFHSETGMMRYIKSLERKDLALNHSMISLGSPGILRMPLNRHLHSIEFA